MTALSARQEELKQRFMSQRGYWNPLWEEVLKSSAEFFEGYLMLSAAPWISGTLPPKLKELIYVAMNVTALHLYEPGTRIHAANAIKYGATKDDLAEIMHMASLIGIYSWTMGLPVMLDELRKAGRADTTPAMDDRRKALKEKFITARGYWDDAWESLVLHNPDFFDAYLQFSTFPQREGGLTPKERELIFIGLEAVTPHLYEPGLRAHLQQALRLGATQAEIAEVLQMVSAIGIHSYMTGLPVLLDEIRKAGSSR